MLKMLLKCPNKFVSADYIRDKLSIEDKITSFGLCSGYIEMDLFEKGYDISMVTNRYWTYEFWRCLANSPNDVLSSVEYYHEKLNTQNIAQYRENWFERFENPYDRSAIYYLLNRYSKSGSLYDVDFTKHNFSRLTLSFLKRCAHSAKDIKLSYVQEENSHDIITNISPNSVLLLPIGVYKNNYVIQKNTQAINAPSYDYNKLKSLLSKKEYKMIILHKYDQRADQFYENKTYINKLGTVTDDPSLAEDLIVSNF